MATYTITQAYQAENYDFNGNPAPIAFAKGETVEGTPKQPFKDGEQLDGIETTKKNVSVFIPSRYIQKVTPWYVWVLGILIISGVVWLIFKISKARENRKKSVKLLKKILNN